MIRPALALALLASCTDEVVVTPVIDVPSAGDPDAEAFHVIDELEIAIAPEGSESDDASKSFHPGDTLELPGVPFGSNVVVHLTGLSGTTQVGYGRTCAFSVSPSAAVLEPHVFFSTSRKFATMSDDIRTEQRTRGDVFSIDGSAILVGGGTQAIEQFDPLAGTLTQPGTLAQRTGAVGALIGVSPRRIVLVGGQPAGIVELYSPNEGLETIADARMDGRGLTATSLADGHVIVVGGLPGATPSPAIIELTPEGTTAQIQPVAMLAHPRWGHTATRLGDDLGAPVLIAGGLDGDGGAEVPIAELYRPLSRTLSPLFAPPMRHPRTGHHAARMPDGSVLFIGGVDAAGNPVRDLERFTIDEGFIDVVDSGGRAVVLDPSIGVIDMSVTQLPDNRLLIAGGHPDGNANGAPTNVAFVLRLDPGTGTLDVSPTDKLAIPRAGHQAALLCDGTVFISGGSEEPLVERYNPPPAGRR